MRKYGFVKGNSRFKKVMLAGLLDDYFVFLYDSEEDGFAIQSKRFQTREAMEQHLASIEGTVEEWFEIADPLAFCKYDLIVPTRLVGQDRNEPNTVNLWEKYIDGAWVKYLFTEDGEWKKIDE